MTRTSLLLACMLVLGGAAPVAAEPEAAGGAWEGRAVLGPASDLGSRALAVTRLRAAATSTTGKSGLVATSSTVPTRYDTSGTWDSLGLMLDLGLDWVEKGQPGWGVGLFGVGLGSALSTDVMVLNGESSSLYLGSSADGTSTSVSDAVTVRPLLPGVMLNNYVATTTPQRGNPPNPLENTVVTTAFTGFTSVPGAPGLTMSQGATAPRNPSTAYESRGGVRFEHARLLLFSELDLHGRLPLVDGPAGQLDLLGGVAMPVGLDRRGFTARTVDEKGSGDTATQLQTVTTDATGGQAYTVATAWRLKESITAEAGYIGLGPSVGLSFRRRLGDGQLVAQLGYVPAFAGAVTNSYQVILDNQVSETTTVTAGSPGVAAGTKSNGLATSTPSQSTGSLAGTEMRASVGTRFAWGQFELTSEAQVRSYNLTPVGNLLLWGFTFGATSRF